MSEPTALEQGPPWLKHYPVGVDWGASLPVHPLPELFAQTVARFPERPCLDFMDKRMTYREVGQQVDRLAAGLQGMGIGKGHRVGLFLPNVPYFVIAFYAILKTGACVVNYNPLYVERELHHQIQDSGTEVMITLDLAVLYDKLAPLLGRTSLARIVVCRMADCLPFPKNVMFPLVKRAELAHIPHDDRHISFTSLTAGSSQGAAVVLDPHEDIAVLQYTGGTTGTPKGAMLSHANLAVNALQCTRWVPNVQAGQERMLAVLPFFHVFALTVALNTAILLGCEIILVPRYNLDDLLTTIVRKKPTFFPAVPTIYTAINAHPRGNEYDLTSIRFCISGGAPLPLEVKQQFESKTGCMLIEGYGLTESAPVACINPPQGPVRPGAVGLPVPGTTIEIVSLEDDVTPLPPGQRGQVCIHGPQVMKGYWNRPADTALVLHHDRLYTGDVGIMDEDGFVFIVDRLKDIIICGGFNVYPRMVEEAIYLHPEVEEVVVAGRPDPYRGQTVKAYIKLSAGARLNKAQLLAFLNDKLSPIEMPKQIEFRDQLPKTMIGKLSRKHLLEEEATRDVRS